MLYNYKGSKLIKYATQLLMLTDVRTIELRAAEWSEFDLDNALWEVPKERMKKRRPQWSGHRSRLRHTMSTISHEKGYNSAWIENQLAHVDKNFIRVTYNHAQYLEGRREMLQWYSDNLY